MKRLCCFILAALCALLPLAASAEATDYADPALWAYHAVGADKPADVFLIAPTVDMGADGRMNMILTDETNRERFVGALNMERGIYEDTLTLYAPFYRQATMPAEMLPYDEAEAYLAVAYADVREAFLHYLAHAPADRPLVLAGFSQGSDMALRLLKEFFAESPLRERLIAAYLIGWRVTDDDLNAFPHLIPARGADDTGVIVSFNTEAVGVMGSIIVPEGVKTYGINPLSWSTDSAPADRSLNLGACFTDYDGNIKSEVSALTGAYLDPARGTLKATDVSPADYANKYFPDGVYHLFDYQFFYRNLQANVALRTQTYLDQLALDDAA